mmetsp:Transcript_1538/g.3404  ORF Transcript_1538/g.3404 Transcript_1538/m.3404 type:complete len:797 (+) Transcript_1538:273-2663(+)
MKALSSFRRKLSPLPLQSSKIRNSGRKRVIGKEYLFFALLMLLTFHLAHSFSTASFQIKTTTTPVRRRKSSQNPIGARIGSRNIGHSYGRSIHTSLASDTSLDYYDPYVTVNKIEPKTETISGSLVFYARFLVNHFWKKPHKSKDTRNMIQRLLRRNVKPKTEEDNMWKKMNEQRKNIMTLAGYTISFVVPSFGFLLLGAFMTSIVPSYWGKCIQCVATLTATKAQLIEALVGLGVSSVLAGLFTGIRGSLFWIGGCRANYNIRVKLHRSLLLQEAAFFDTNETGYLLSRLNSDVNKIGQVISYHVNVVLRQFAQFVFGSIYLLRISPRLSMYTFAGILLVAFLSAVYGDLARDLAEKVQDTFADATAVAETSFTMSETIRAFDGVDIESDKFEAAQFSALELEEVQAWAYGTHKFLSDTLQSVLQLALLVACWTVGKAGGLPATDLTTFMFYTGFVLESSNEVGDQWAKIQQAVGASSSVFELIKRIPAIHDPQPSDTTSANASTTVETKSDAIGLTAQKPVIAIKNVTLKYDAMDRPALSGINTNIYSGDRVALVGRSGSGKSSMLRTMLRFYDPSSGGIELDGEDLRSLTRAETASHVSLVEQEPHVFPMSLMENVLYGIDKDDMDPDTGDAVYNVRWRNLVSDCLKLAGLPIAPGNELGLDLDTRIGEGGRSLSGGQRQRVAIARAIIREPQVLLLDEPTAALDSESEKKVVQSLRMAMEQTKSMVMVTHRLGVIRLLDVNRIIVLDKGKIVEEGHPEDLLKDEGSLYAGLAKEQGITQLDDLEQEVSHASN